MKTALIRSILLGAAAALAVLLFSGCVVHKAIDATYATYGLALQAPPTPVSPPFGLCVGVTKVSYHSLPVAGTNAP